MSVARPSVDSDLPAARLALLVMRGNTAHIAPLGSPSYLVPPSRVPLSPEEMAADLAARPKPIACRAVARDLALAIECAPIESQPDGASRERVQVAAARLGPLFPELARRLGDRYASARIYCLGFGEALVVMAGDVEGFRRDYDVHPGGWSGWPPAEYRRIDPGVTAAAEAVGAEYIIKCYWRADERR